MHFLSLHMIHQNMKLDYNCLNHGGRATNLQGEAFMDPALDNGKRVHFHVFDAAGTASVDDIHTDPTALDT